ncbi:SURF1 family protein [Noviherbaspirillum agri]
MRTKFRFRWIPFLAATIACAIGISLGQWQTRRAAEKESIEAKLTARESAEPVRLAGATESVEDVEYRRISVEGNFLREWTVFLDNRPYKGAAGFYVLTPMKLAGSDLHILVARGWVKRDIADRTRVPEIATPKGTIEITGIARRHVGQVLQLGTPEPLRSNAIVQNLDAAQFADVAGLKMLPFILQQTTDLQDGLVRDWPRPSTGVEKHRGYAFQWYALAASALLFFVVTGFRRGTK